MILLNERSVCQLGCAERSGTHLGDSMRPTSIVLYPSLQWLLESGSRVGQVGYGALCQQPVLFVQVDLPGSLGR